MIEGIAAAIQQGGEEDLDGCKCKPKKCYKPNITIREKHHNKSLFIATTNGLI